MLITETFSKVLLKFYMLFCVCMYCADLMVWIDPLIAVSLKTRLPEGYCKCMCERDRERERERERERDSFCLNCVSQSWWFGLTLYLPCPLKPDC